MNLRTRVLVCSGIIGALVGVGAAYLYLREAPVEVSDAGEEKLPAVQPGDALRVSLGILTAIRGIVGLARPGS